jgi:hypothetical protein
MQLESPRNDNFKNEEVLLDLKIDDASRRENNK